MTEDALLLIGRETGEASGVSETHGRRLRRRGVADTVHVATYDHDPRRDMRGTVTDIDADRVFAVPLCLAHTRETVDRLPRALAGLSGDLHYCEPVGRSPALTEAIRDRAREERAPDVATTLVLVAFGNTGGSYYRDVTATHADRLRADTDYAAVTSCYLLQNPAVECVRYNVSTPAAVAVPLFVAPCPATREEIPDRLELDRGGIEYASALGTHSRVTDAIQDRVETRRAIASSDGPRSFEDAVAGSARPLATDGEGPVR